ncbi:hypothetical protein CSOJ01_08048 [Colletotrichum sojae]|uniref:Uncharacterized protein n=1 Tax=Colletotrichum sojae TaxID=2175907 RepID=A0A8H6J745_9PEZI|nr:hypothetical protein CSOJ01_08048 [Colletotrichum sojae]
MEFSFQWSAGASRAGRDGLALRHSRWTRGGVRDISGRVAIGAQYAARSDTVRIDEDMQNFPHDGGENHRPENPIEPTISYDTGRPKHASPNGRRSLRPNGTPSAVRTRGSTSDPVWRTRHAIEPSPGGPCRASVRERERRFPPRTWDEMWRPSDRERDGPRIPAETAQ